jgi:hypothetical protein
MLGETMRNWLPCSWLGIGLWSLAAAASAQAPPAGPKPALAVESRFPGGSALVEGIDQQNRVIRVKPTPHADLGWICWWYFKVTGIEPGEMLTLDVGEGVWATPDQAAFSLDQRAWRHTAPGQRKEKRIVYRQQVDGPEAWFAWGPPFVPDDAARLVEEAAHASPFAVAFELCRTRQGRAVPALRVSQPGAGEAERFGIWIQARQHAWESGSSWVCRGFAEWLVSDDPRAEALRGKALVTIVPIMDVDNVAVGAGGKEQKPQDHNRDWSDQPHWKSVEAAQREISALDRSGRFDLFVDLHNPGPSDRNPYYYAAPRELLTELGRRNLDQFVAATREEMTGPLKFLGKVLESGANYDRNWQRISKNWVSQHTRDHVVSVTLETAWNTPSSTAENYQRVGRELGLAIERYLRTAARREGR